MYNEEFGLGNVESNVVEPPSKEERIKYSYLLMGYHEAICRLSTLDYKSEPIQTLVGLIYDLMQELKMLYVDPDTALTPEAFADEHIDLLFWQEEQLLESYGEDSFNFLLNSIIYFGENTEINDCIL